MATPVSRATSASFAVDGPGIGSARSNNRKSSRWQKYCVRKSSGRQTMFAPSRAASRMRLSAEAKFASGSAPMRICTRATVNLRAVVIFLPSVLRQSRTRPRRQGQPRQAELASNPLNRQLDRSSPASNLIQRPAARSAYSSSISTAAAMVVVHLPRLSPTADWVKLLVRTILLEMR